MIQAPSPDCPTAVAIEPTRHHPPLLHNLVTIVDSPVVVLGSYDGRIRAGGVEGFFADDLRLLSEFELHIAGTELEHIATSQVDAARVSFAYVARGLGEDQADPTVYVSLDRSLIDSHLVSVIEVCSAAADPVEIDLVVTLRADLAPLGEVRAGRRRSPVRPSDPGPGETSIDWGCAMVVATADPAPKLIGADRMGWNLPLQRGERARVEVHIAPRVARATASSPFAGVSLRCDDTTLAEFFQHSIDDLNALSTLAADGDEVFFAGGSPWYLTLFGRDALWSARMTLPFGTAVALDTLRVLARRQGRRVDARTAEEPGKILHELRADDAVSDLPPVFYGSSDATSLWVALLAEAYRWGAPRLEVEALLPALEAALGWLRDYSDHDGDGFVDYAPIDQIGAINQGWKDSPDSIHDAQGNLATGAVVLAEMQAYAHEAASSGAWLLAEFGRDGAEWRAWAAELRARFREQFWPTRPGPRWLPALGFDGTGSRLDAVTSNLGHLLGTGLLSPVEEIAVADALGSSALLGPFGLRTLETTSPRYNPISYHNGSVWPHDNAIAIRGLLAAGRPDLAQQIARGLVAGSRAFGGRVPELWGGDSLPGGLAPLVYPGACRPQAWSAASAVVVVTAALGLAVDVDSHTVRLSPWTPFPFGALELHGVRIAGHPVEIVVDSAGVASVTGLPTGWTVSR